MPIILFPVPTVMKLLTAARRRFGPLTTGASTETALGCCSVSEVVISGVGVDVDLDVGVGFRVDTGVDVYMGMDVGVEMGVDVGVNVGVETALIV
ncbi:MAG: hypothetical protein A2117_00050 [Candidatus Wildermuthbacteria bacterium GWA2_46_15]|uniref:Uncharacterized protein n=1 Tax=Candidatus Wildermuthbacteria bacterium GWA2_46_15 TaxID=1802443 RepID=A0A1G2QN75_9BACT|nr:MAG: hypothetical protein A2117_00050 [Candidatus Wildermuthbacteria bacterium GWA2_46_15]